MNNETAIDQSVHMSGRSRIELTGITDVESFSDTSVIACSSLGNISIDGEELKVESFSAETGRLIVNGNLDGFCYYGREVRRRRLFSRNR